MNRILQLLELDARLSPARIAEILNLSETEVRRQIQEYENDNIILGYKTVIDWDKTERDSVTALVEVRCSPQTGRGFDELASQICSYPQVESLYLMSGSFDLTIVINGRNLMDISRFISENLAPMENIISTATHFILKKYKDAGVDYNPEDGREDF